MEFIKMHGLGNDFIVVDQLDVQDITDPAALARALCPRGLSVGADGLVLLMPSDSCDARMRIFNPDGSEPEMCGNAVRCVAKFMYEKGLVKDDRLDIETLAGVMKIALRTSDGKFVAAGVDMGVPMVTGLHTIPVAGHMAAFTAVSTGNPHAVTFDIWPDDETFRKYGPMIEHSPLFPAGTNVEFCRIESRSFARIRVWERGAGPTLACGTGATATFFAAVSAGLMDKRATMALPGGELEFELLENGHAIMTGPADTAYTGRI